jgi:sugar phosphate isomerase/epimerase
MATIKTSERTKPVVVRSAPARVALSSASVYPESLTAAFEIAAALGYDGLELMVHGDPATQDIDEVERLSNRYDVPVLAIHSPCLLVTQRVWGTDPWAKLVRSREAAEQLGARTVVVHPAFRWQVEYARSFVEGIAQLEDDTDVRFAVENMYPWRARRAALPAYSPSWDPRAHDYSHVTLDLSHTAVSGTDPREMAADLGSKLVHIHLADGTGSPRDEHLVPGRGEQPCGELLESLAGSGFIGDVIVEVSTRGVLTRAEREEDLAEALAFARLHLVTSDEPVESRPSAKKAAAKKTAKKAPAEAATKKAPAKKAPAKKAATNKTTAKKSAAKKAADS